MEYDKILRRFNTEGKLLSCVPYGNGHINDTFLAVFGNGKEEERLILQKINRNVFREPEKVMENVAGVIEWIARKVKEAGGEEEREVLSLIRGSSGRYYETDESGEYWRLYRFIPDAVCYERPENAEVFRQSAFAFGNFQRQLADYPAESLHEVIPGFHDTPARYLEFEKTVHLDPAGRAASCGKETAYLTGMRKLGERLTEAHRKGLLPKRVTHNDTKLNNVMMDKRTGKALCVLDLDTVMCGFSVTDFGDAIRFGACTAAEDEPDLSKVHFDRELYRIYREGYLEGCGGSLLENEAGLLFDGALVITYEQALRFLTDYLKGDVYYKVDYPEHNLIRARTQIRLLQEMAENKI